MYNEYEEDDDIIGPDDDEIQSEAEISEFRDFIEICPSCKNELSGEHDSCPFCGDILYRYLKDHTFAPKKGPLTRVFAWGIVIIAVLGSIAMILSFTGIM
ncbi:MAG: hypothetical protein JEZ07_15220 [Phycisphaerae bacterium]|nr:hypothetical protein [Phycisphaerae bacterium]